MHKILDMPTSLRRMIGLIDLLRTLVEKRECSFITSPDYINSVHENDGKLRMVNDHVMNHFQSPISLNDITDRISIKL